MSWLCKNCETLNDDNDNICLVCNSVPPSISEISWDCRKSQVSWACSNINQLTLRYSQGDFNVTGLTFTSIDISVVETLVFIAKNDVAERCFRVTVPRSFVQEVIKYKKDDETWTLASRRGTREDIEHYLSLYPDGRHIRAANNRLSKIEEEEKAQIAADEAAWKTTLASKTESAYRYYLTHFPSGIHIVEANKLLKQLIKEIDDRNWEKALSINTIEAYREYISVSENKTREKAANSHINKIIDENDWKTASRLDTIEGYVEYINKHYPHSNIHWSEAQSAIKRLRDAEDEERWKHACGNDSLEAYKDYLSKCPEGNHIVECKSRIDEKAWQYAASVNTIAAYQAYVKSYKYGKHVPDAKTRIDSLTSELDNQAWEVAKNTDTIESYKRYEKNHPYGKHLYDCRKKLMFLNDVRQWQKARSANTVLEYKSYLTSFPTGLHAEEARKKIEKLTKKGNSGWITAILVLIVAAIIGYILYVNINDGSYGSTFRNDHPGMIQNPNGGASTKSSSSPSISSSEIASIKNSLDRRLPGMEEAKKDELIPTGISGAQKQINKLKDANDPSWRTYQNRLDKLK